MVQCCLLFHSPNSVPEPMEELPLPSDLIESFNEDKKSKDEATPSFNVDDEIVNDEFQDKENVGNIMEDSTEKNPDQNVVELYKGVKIYQKSCLLCESSHADFESFRKHMLTEHTTKSSNEDPFFQCANCETKKSTLDDFCYHFGDYLYKCLQCKMNYGRVDY